MSLSARFAAKQIAGERQPRKFELPLSKQGQALKPSEYFGVNVFNIEQASSIPSEIKEDIKNIVKSGKHLPKTHAEIVAQAVSNWATQKGATHFCHWFQPLTGSTAEKHDAFLDFNESLQPIEALSAGQLMQGEPDASSFPSGGSRATFEARGYTSWDITSPMFIIEGINGKTLCIPTAFVSYTGEALDIKTPLLRSITALSKQATEFLKLTGRNVNSVNSTCGAEQEYFLVDRAYYSLRPDLIMSGRGLFGSMPTRNQQLEDHYFGTIPSRVEAFMHELEMELYKLGIAAKTRHNEVAPGQFEIAPIFCGANLAADQNQLVMATMKNVANKHEFVALLHEKPFHSINGSGKHVNWSMSDDLGNNLLSPGDKPHENHRFMAIVSIIMEAVKRHSKLLRAAIASPGNDHRLGANEAPPSIISIFLGDTLTEVFESIRSGATFEPNGKNYLDIGAEQLAQLLQDNTDRNRTSPFAFTGNKFEFRAVGSSAPIGLPLSVLNAAVADVFTESNTYLKQLIDSGKSVSTALTELTKKWIESSWDVVFNGDGYSDEWVKEAERRGLPNLKTTPDVLDVFKDESLNNFLVSQGVFKPAELTARYNVLVERYIKIRDIEFGTLRRLVYQNVLPDAFKYKEKLVSLVSKLKENKLDASVELGYLELLTDRVKDVNEMTTKLHQLRIETDRLEEKEQSFKIAYELLPLAEDIAKACSRLETIVPDDLWSLPKTYEMLFVR